LTSQVQTKVFEHTGFSQIFRKDAKMGNIRHGAPAFMPKTFEAQFVVSKAVSQQVNASH
jgi:hypothetical protein